jgi:CRP/FNR family transcriptional regulator, cyclic AMP receptor protein
MNSSEKSSATPSCEFQENLKILRLIYFFSALPLETLKIFAYLCTREIFKKGEYIFRQDDDDGQAFYIIAGSAELERIDNGKTINIRTCNSGEFLGGLTLLGETRRHYSLKAMSDTICLVLNREKFSKTMGQFPDLMAKICKAVVESIDNWEQRFLSDRADACGGCMERLGVTLI